MTYDHRTKAGNQGDVIKHVALMAAARHALDGKASTFKYADAYAGPAGSLLVPGGEWASGVGKINRSIEACSVDVARWLRWYLARPQPVGSRYPGSSLIMADAAADARRRIRMTLWDISREVIEDLRKVFPDQDVRHESVLETAEAIRSADLLFIDPPTLTDQWPLLLSLMTHGRNMLAWLPINAAVRHGSVKPSSISETQFEEVSAIPSICSTRVLWAHGGRTIGCLLVYRSTKQGVASIREAVDEVITMCSWTRKDVEHFDCRLK